MGNLISTGSKHFNGQFITTGFEKIQEQCTNFEVLDSDVWLICFPKTGSTWMHEMLWLIAHDYNYKDAQVPTEYRTPYFDKPFLGIEVNTIFRRAMVDTKPEILKEVTQNEEAGKFALDSLKLMETMEGPRVVKTHLNWNNIPKQLKDASKKPRIVYLTRNPKDVCISFLHFLKLLHGSKDTIDVFAEKFFNDEVPFAPFFDHVLPFWERRNELNILFVTYEEMNADLRGVILKVTAFLGKTINNEQMAQLLNHLSINKMRQNKSINNDQIISIAKEMLKHDFEGTFINKGKTGNFKEVMSPELIEKFDKWTEEKLKGTGFKFQL